MTEQSQIREAENRSAGPQGHSGSARQGAERDKRKPMVSWAALLDEAVKKPGIIHDAYSRFHNYSPGNHLLALYECVERGLQPAPLPSYRKWKEFGRHVKKGEKALTLCTLITCRRTKSVTAADGSEKDEEFAFTHFTYRAQWYHQRARSVPNTIENQKERYGRKRVSLTVRRRQRLGG
jgi:N-terminal domain of anti-restriction factor ArdC